MRSPDVVPASLIGALLRQHLAELRLLWRRPADSSTTLLFFLSVSGLFPFGVGADPAMLRSIGAGVVWVSALLAVLLGLGRLFAVDYHDGTLEQLVLSPYPLSMLVLAKAGAHWLAHGLPIAIAAPLVAVQYQLSPAAGAVLALSLAAGSLALVMIGMVGSALTLGLRGGGALLGLMMFPLFVPVLIFGSAATLAAEVGSSIEASLSLLGAAACISLVLGPPCTAAALRIALE